MNAEVDRTQATASVMEKAQHSSLYAEQQVLNYDQPLNYKWVQSIAKAAAMEASQQMYHMQPCFMDAVI